MPKRILIIGRSHHPDGKETADEIYQSLSKIESFQEYDLRLSHYHDLLFDISTGSTTVIDTKNGLDLASVDCALMTNWFSHASVRKDIALTLGCFFHANKIPFFNTEALYIRSSSKLSQMIIAAQHGIRIPRTLFALSFDELANYAEAKFSYPIIFKDAQGSRGNDNHLITTHEEAIALMPSHSETHPYIAQEYIDSGKEDYRIFVVGGKPQLGIKRIGSDYSHLTNTSAGASTELVKPESIGKEAMGFVNTMSELLHREVTGVDIMFDKDNNKPYFLEANPIPQIATGSNIEKKINALADALAEAANSKEIG
jgi:glutathione synthase/RimK-type ligase-like ATP-grasp enzyme